MKISERLNALADEVLDKAGRLPDADCERREAHLDLRHMIQAAAGIAAMYEETGDV